MAFEYKRKNKSGTSAESTTPKFTYTRDKTKRDKLSAPKTPGSGNKIAESIFSQDKYKILSAENVLSKMAEKELSQFNKWKSEQDRLLNYDVDSATNDVNKYKSAINEFSEYQIKRNDLESELSKIQSVLANESASGYETQKDKARIDEIEKELSKLSHLEDLISQKYGIKGDFNKNELKSKIAELQRDIAYATYKQTGEKLKREALSAPDFESNNKYGKTNAIGTDIVKTYLNSFHKDLTLNNPITDPSHEWYGGGSLTERGHDFYEAMTDEEKKILGYYISTDVKKAEDYINAITEAVGSRVALGYASEADTWYDKLLFSFASGYDQFEAGLAGLGDAFVGSEKYRPISPIQMGSGKIRQDIDEGEGFWNGALGIAYDLGANTSNMLPSVLVGMVNPIAGATLLGASAAGNAYSEMINLGYSKNQARAYGTMVGASEALLEKALGGISAFGGGGKLASKALSKIDNAIARVAIQTGDSMLSEFTEESLQTILEPWFKSIVTGLDYDAPNVDEILYSGLLGALSGGLVEGGGNIVLTPLSNNLAQHQADTELGNAILKHQDAPQTIENIISQANSTQNKKLTRAAQRVDKTKSQSATYQGESVLSYGASARDVGRLARIYQQQLSEIPEAKKSEIISSLRENGMTANEAKKSFKSLFESAVFSHIADGKINPDVQTLIETNPTAKKAYEELVNHTSTEAVQKRFSESPVTKVAEDMLKESFAAAGIEAEDNVQIDDPVSVERIDDYGNVFVKTDSGKSVKWDSDSPTMSASAHEKMAYASLFSTNGANAYLKLAPERASTKYKEDFDVVYSQGLRGKKFNAVDSNIGLEVQKAIYEAGKADLEAAAAKSRAEAEKAKKKEAEFVKKQIGFKSNLVTVSDAAIEKIKASRDKGFLEQYNASVAVINEVAQMLQVKINIVASETGADGKYVSPNGVYNSATNTFTLDITAGMNNADEVTYTAIVKTLGHELTHFIQNWSPSKYIKLKNNVIRFLEQEHKEDIGWLNTELERIRADNDAIGNKITLEQAKDELVADSFENILSDVDFASLVLKTDKTLFEKVHSWLKDRVKSFKKIIGKAVENLGTQSAAGETIADAGKRAQALLDEWSDAFITALENSTARSENASSSVQYSARNVTGNLDISTRRDLVNVLETRAKEVSVKKQAQYNATIAAYKLALDEYAKTREDLIKALSDGNESATSILTATLLLRERTVKNIENRKMLVDALQDLILSNPEARQAFEKRQAPKTALTKKSVETVAAKLMNIAGVYHGSQELTNTLQSFYERAYSAENLAWEDIVAGATPIAEWIVSNRAREKRNDLYNDIIKIVRGERVYLTEAQKSEVAYKYENFNDFRKKAFGKIIISSEATQSISDLWQTLSGEYPDVFNVDAKKEMIPELLLKTLDRLKDSAMYENELTPAQENQLKQYLINEIHEGYNDTASRRKALDYGKYEELMKGAKITISALRDNLTSAERAVRDSASKAQRAEFRAKQAELRRSRDAHIFTLSKLRTKLRQAMDKPTERISIPSGGEPLAKQLLQITGTLNELLRTRALATSDEELIAIVSNTAMANALEQKSYNGTNVDTATRKLRLSNRLQDQLGKELGVLKRQYADIKEKPTVDMAYREELATRLDEYITENTEYFGGGDELIRHVADGIRLMQAISHRLMSANRAMVAGKWIDIIDLRTKLFEDVDIAPSKSYKTLSKLDSILNPEVMLHLAFGHTENSDTLYGFYNDAQNKYMRYVVGAKDIFKDLDSKNTKKALLSKTPTIKTGLKDTNGNEVLLNPDLAISFVLASENEDYLRHMIWGGFQLPDLNKLYSGNASDAYALNRMTEHLTSELSIRDYLAETITDEDIAKALDRIEKRGDIDLDDKDFIVLQAKREFEANGTAASESEMRKKYISAARMIKSQLDPVATEWMNRIRNYYNDYAKRNLDETTMERYGYVKTMKNRYYPIHVVKEQVGTEETPLMRYDKTLESMGSMKSRVKSKAGVELFGAISSLNDQIESTAKYYGWINSLDTIKKILNSRIDLDNGDKSTLQGYVSSVHGDKRAKRYFDVLESDISGNSKPDSGMERIFSNLHSAFVTAALSFNISTMLKQASAIPLVAAKSGYRNLSKGLGKGMWSSNRPWISKEQQEHIARYSLVYKYRSGGLMNIDIAALRNTENPISKFMQKHPYATGTAWPEAMDAQVLGYQWFALRETVKKAHPDWDAEQINVETGKLLDETIQKFQANYTVLQRSPLLRGKGFAKLAFGTFRSQQLTMLNTQIDAALKCYTLQNQIKAGHGDTAKLKGELHAARKYAAKVAAASAVSYMVNAALAVGISLLYKRKDLDDALLEDAAWDMLQSYMSMLPGAGDVLYLILEQINDRGYYGDGFAEIGLISMVEDLVSVFTRIGEGDLTVDRVAKDVGKLLAPFGIPARNAWNIVKAFFEWLGIEIE